MRTTVTLVLLLGAAWPRFVAASDRPQNAAAEAADLAGPEDTFHVTLGFVGGYGFALSAGSAALELPAGLNLKDPAGIDLPVPAIDGLGYAALVARAYLPWFIAVEVGVGVVYAHSTLVTPSASGVTTATREDVALELPLLAGAYYPLFGQLFLAALAGPVLMSGPADVEGGAGGLGDALADPIVGFAAVASVEWIPFELLAIGVELRYRYLVGGELSYDLAGLPANDRGEQFEADQAVRTYPLDLSGLAVQLSVRLVL
jgi:hypothetical protein